MNTEHISCPHAVADGSGTDIIAAVVPAHGPLRAELIDAVTAVARRAEDAADGPHCVVLFIQGARSGEYRAWPGEVTVGEVSKWEGALRRLEQVPLPIIAAVDGDAYGPAAELLLVADYRILRVDAEFRFASTEAGVWPAMAVYRLVAQVGVARARDLVIQGRALAAQQALERGLVDMVVTDSAAETDALRAGAALFDSAVGTELAIRRRLLLDAVTTRFEDALGAHLAASDRTLRRDRAAS
ncbi:enoyl-CoA-hydratase DpgB [Nocardia terpenica]|uniref:Enoyl-CoA hydratase/isomerase family protein n=1 Tax=Nocardia terpenica TaxID=455432 RepID=A0A6G9ZB73_9NOCA|nr:enoyl-CoA-hydratase DpgB [Nocardia terpenica]QIS22263.1 enoyl-CoA hydratase/isomerase family protein [Nocardia terpenica]